MENNLDKLEIELNSPKAISHETINPTTISHDINHQEACETSAVQAVMPYSPYCAAPDKTEKKFTQTEHLAALICVVLGVIFARYLMLNILGFFSTLTVLLMVGAFVWYFKSSGIEITKQSRGFAIIICAFSLVFSITDNDTIKATTEIFILALGAYWVYFTCNKCKKIDENFCFEISNAIISQPFSEYFSTPSATLKASQKSGGRVKHILIGLVIAVPITIVVASQLAQADKVIAKIFRKFLINFQFNIFELIVTMLFGFAVACYLFGMLYASSNGKRAQKLTKEAFDIKRANRRVIPNAIVYTALTPTIALYVLFFILQSNYFLSAFSGALPDGYSYAEFARRGFFELFNLAIFNFVFVVFINTFTISSGEKRTIILRIFTSLLCGFTILIIVTSLSKMIMYIGEFGLTRYRLYTSWTMVLMAIVFVLIIVLQFKPKLNIMRVTFGIFVVMMAVLCFSQSDNLIAKYNLMMYTEGHHKELDGTYLAYDLSYDAFEVLQENGVYVNEYYGHPMDESELAADKLQSDFSYNKFSNYNISKLVAKEKLVKIVLEGK